MSRGIKVNENWKQQYNQELLQLFRDSYILSSVRISRMNQTGYVNRMNSKRKVSQVLNNNP